jgi:hypothetical protein
MLHRNCSPLETNYGNVAHVSWLVCINIKGTDMLKIAALSSTLAIGLVSGAYAQTTVPAGQQDKAAMTNSNSDAVKKDSTTGMSNTKNKETGWSGISEKGTAYDGPAPKTTTGPAGAGSGSKTDSPEK